MSLRRTYRCIVIGEGTLPLLCGEALLARSHTIAALVAPMAGAREWSTQRGIRRLDADADLTGALANESVDFLFSIVNPRILGADTCAIAGRGAINYHDALLPRYAGVHATTWAIMAGERVHGITWHEVAERLDAGRIYLQHVVPIAPDDTALTLDVKCYEAAAASFVELLDGLERESLTPRVQLLANRSFFGRHRRPPGGAAIDWDQPAATVSAFVRALDFGVRPNPIALPKLWIRGVPYACRTVHLLNDLASSVPGTIAAIDNAGLVVAARDQLVRIPALATLTGDAVDLNLLGLHPGERLTGPSSADLAHINERVAQTARYEKLWVQRLSELRAPVLPAAHWDASACELAGRGSVTVRLPGTSIEAVRSSDEATIVAALAVYLTRIGDGAPFDITVTHATSSARDALFMSWFPARCNVGLTASFREVVSAIRKQLRELRAQASIASDVVARYPSLRDVLAVARTLRVGVTVGDPQISPPVAHEAALLFVTAPDGQSARLYFDTSFAPHDMAKRIAEGIEALLADAARYPWRSVGELAIMSDADQALVLHTWNDTRVPYQRDATIAELFARMATATPDAVAISEDTGQLTYRALNERANQLAHRLQRLGVSADTIVGHRVDRSADAIVAMLGILKAGGAYLPLDASNPSSRLAQMLRDGDVPIIVTSMPSMATMPTDSTRSIVCVDDASLRDERTDTPRSNTRAVDLAYVMYTSGSTGRPKGVAVTHRGVVRLVSNTNYAHLGANDALLGFAPLAFDASTFEIWGALLNGGRLALFPNHLPTPFELGEFINRQGVTTVWLTSALFSEMVEFALPTLRNVRQLLTGGDVLSPAHVRRVLRELPDCRLINAYGPTENTTFTTCHTVSHACIDEPAHAPVPIGRPIANSIAYVLDARRQPVPIGVVGELYAGGDGLAREYVNDTSATAMHFVPDPFNALSGERLYATGDLARWRGDGVLEFVGRRDAQVKIRGFRVEVGEIEAALLTHPYVRQVAVVALRDRPGDPQLVVYYTPGALSGERPSPRQLRNHLLELLPAYMVPMVFVSVSEWPLTVTGKLDRAALPHAGDNRATQGGPAPTSPIEIALSAIWRDVLGVPHVSTVDDFFVLGGHSLLAMRVLSRITDQFGVRLPFRTMFESPTIAGLATRIASTFINQNATCDGVTVNAAIDATPQPLSLGQEVLWLLQRTMPTLDAYNVAEQWCIDGRINVGVLESALTALVDRHAALRTTFADGDNGPVQIVRPAAAVRVELVDVNGASEEELIAIVQHRVRRPFDLSQDLLLRAVVLRESDASHRLVIVTHHLVDDGWSRAILRRELSELYDALAAGRTASLAAPTLPYTAFVTWQRASMANGQRPHHDAYWRGRLSGWQPTSYVRADRPRPTTMLFDGAAVTVELSGETTGRIRATARANGATPFMVLFAAFQLLLHRYSGENDVVVGSVSASREQREWEDVIGYFATPMPIRTSFDGDPTFAELIARVRDEQLRAMEHAAVPVELVMTEPLPGEVARPLPLFRVMCVLQNNEQVALRIGAAVTREIPVAPGTAKFDLSLLLTERDETIDATVEYRTSMFDDATMARLLGHFNVLLQAAVHAPETRGSRLPLVSATERRHLLVDWNAASAPLDERCLHDLVNEQVQRSPGAIAVVGVDSRLTYAELRQRAQVLAHDLVRRGVGPGVLVGVCVERSVHLIVALLAVLEAGGAYVPLDPDYPPDRLRFMLEDAAVSVVLTAGSSRDVLPLHNAATLHLDDAYWDRAAGDIVGPIAPRRAVADDLAYVIYTSGSTGRPKGAMNTHRAVCNFVRRSVEIHGFAAGDTVLQKTPVSFDPSVWEIFGALTTGARLVLARPRGHVDPTYLASVLAQQQVTMMNIVPSMLQALLDVTSLSSLAGSLRIIVCGGETMTPALQMRCFALLPAVRLHNAYGPTETAVNSCDWECKRDDARLVIPIGRPLSNVRVYCLDEAREPVPPGVVGELYIGGVAVGTGYLAKPELTAGRFLTWPHPLRPHQVERLFRTGDLARLNRDGVIEYLGRRDHQIKLRGVRIELGEVEAALAAHPALRAATVVARDDAPNGDQRLVAYVVPHAGAVVPERVLREHLRGMLLDAMIPSAFVMVDELPMAPTGKVDRNALPAPSYERMADVTFVGPRTDTEITFAGLIAEVLGGSRIGIHDNFFEIGGHSLAAMRVVSRALHMGIPLSVTDLFDHPTVAAIAGIVDARGPAGTATKPGSMSIPRVERAAYRRESTASGGT